MTGVTEGSTSVTARPPSMLSRWWGGLRTFARRSPMAAFWGVISFAIVGMALFANEIAPLDPLKADFRAMGKPPIEGCLLYTSPSPRDPE